MTEQDKPMALQVLVVSDSHGSITRLQDIIDREIPFDCIIHCGDGAGDLMYVQLPPGCPVVRVAGNVDTLRMPEVSRIEVQELGDVSIMVTHGDLFQVNRDYGHLFMEGKHRKVDAIFCGHTHVQYKGNETPVIINPGAANRGQYARCALEKGTVTCVHRTLGD
jgi:uncharacterized protein